VETLKIADCLEIKDLGQKYATTGEDIYLVPAAEYLAAATPTESTRLLLWLEEGIIKGSSNRMDRFIALANVKRAAKYILVGERIA
jgi:hypothetical protein